MENNDAHFNKYMEILIHIIQKKLPGCRVYLFGSRARKTNLPGADIDLALDAGKPIDLSILLSIHGEIEETNVPLMVDLVDMHSASDLFKDVIKEEGILWTH